MKVFEVIIMVICIKSQCSYGLDGVYLSLRDNNLSNNSEVLITDIGDMGREDALICATSLSPCCFGFSNRYGHWYYPNGTEVSNSNGNNNFFRNRGNGSDDGTVRLHRRNNALAPTGKFYCVIPDSSYNNTVTLYVTLVLSRSTTESNIINTVTSEPQTTEVVTNEVPSTETLVTDELTTEGLTTMMQVVTTEKSVETTETPTAETHATEAHTTEELTTMIQVTTTNTPTIEATVQTTETHINTETHTTDQTHNTVDANFTMSVEPDTTTQEYPTESLEEVWFRLRLVNISECITWREDKPEEKRAAVNKAIEMYVENICLCGFTTNQISNSAFLCFKESPMSVTYRARLQGNAQATALKILSSMERWIKDSDSIPVQSSMIKVDEKCTVNVSNTNDNECEADDSLSTNQVVDTQVWIIAGGTIGLAVIILITILFIFVFGIYIHRKRSRFSPKRNTEDSTGDVVLRNMSFSASYDDTLIAPRLNSSSEDFRRYSDMPARRRNTESSRDTVFTNLSCTSGYEQSDIPNAEGESNKRVGTVSRQETPNRTDELSNLSTTSGYVAVDIPKSTNNGQNHTASGNYVFTKNISYSTSPTRQQECVVKILPETIKEEDSEEGNNGEYSYVKIL